MNIRELLTAVKNAIFEEINEGKRWLEINNQLRNEINRLNGVVGNLQTELAKTKNEDVKNLLGELADTETQLQEILSIVGTINPTPVSDTLINTVQSDITVSTPGSLITFTPETNTIPDTSHVSSAVEALGVSLINTGGDVQIEDVLPPNETLIETTEPNVQTPTETSENPV